MLNNLISGCHVSTGIFFLNNNRDLEKKGDQQSVMIQLCTFNQGSRKG